MGNFRKKISLQKSNRHSNNRLQRLLQPKLDFQRKKIIPSTKKTLQTNRKMSSKKSLKKTRYENHPIRIKKPEIRYFSIFEINLKFSLKAKLNILRVITEIIKAC